MMGNPVFEETFHSQAGMKNLDGSIFAQPNTIMDELNSTSLIWSTLDGIQATGMYPMPFVSFTSPTVMVHPPSLTVQRLGQYTMLPFSPPVSDLTQYTN